VLALDELHRTAILGVFFDGLTAAEIARELGVPLSTVRTRVRRGLDLLRHHLDRDTAATGVRGRCRSRRCCERRNPSARPSPGSPEVCS
jgi:IS30 family transposase